MLRENLSEGSLVDTRAYQPYEWKFISRKRKDTFMNEKNRYHIANVAYDMVIINEMLRLHKNVQECICTMFKVLLCWDSLSTQLSTINLSGT